ncbi:MAG: transporter [Candidatus Tectomicrobia bacterium]|uniref:Transporter n=1 Tax=Tectimicrobiota bacterium TaxID=2528274 RepID=A0A932M1P6_UNCTE|nr:transporter [Candidatus Tectomicrobia bacterium]
MKRRGDLRVVVGMIFILLGAAPAFAADPSGSLSTSVDYSKGDYGTGENTTILSVPFMLGVTPIDRLTLSLTVPYIRQTTQTVFVTGGGVAKRQGRERQLSRTEEGLGDILMEGEYVLLGEQLTSPEVAGSLKIKLPTADEDRGLGTGEFDETIGVGFSKTFLERLGLHLDLGYTFIGSPPGTDFRNSFSWSTGAAYLVAQPISVFAFLDGSTAIARDQKNPLEFRFGTEYEPAKAVSLTGSLGVGLSDGSPDHSISGRVAFPF